jgi:hypothetical protein
LNNKETSIPSVGNPLLLEDVATPTEEKNALNNETPFYSSGTSEEVVITQSPTKKQIHN